MGLWGIENAEFKAAEIQGYKLTFSQLKLVVEKCIEDHNTPEGIIYTGPLFSDNDVIIRDIWYMPKNHPDNNITTDSYWHFGIDLQYSTRGSCAIYGVNVVDGTISLFAD